MSLLSGMNDILTNRVAMEAAEDEILFEEEYAMEADELIDLMVDAKEAFVPDENDEDGDGVDDMDELLDEDEEEDELNEEIDAEECAKSYESYYGIASEGSVELFTISYLAGCAVLGYIAGRCDPGTKAANYIKKLQKEYKPKLKELNKTVRKCKRSHDYANAINALKEIIKINQKLKNECKSLSKDIEVGKTVHSSGDVETHFTTKNFESMTVMINRFDDVIAKANLEIKLLTQKSRVANTKKATEAAALTGQSFFDSLLLDNDDPIKTDDGSIGMDDSAANFDKNFTDWLNDDNDPITTSDGAIGQKDSAANFDKNFADWLNDDNDPITTSDGSIGQKDSTAKDPVTESALFFGELMGEEVAVEGLIKKFIDKKDAEIHEKLGVKNITNEVESLDKGKDTSADDYEKIYALIEGYIKEMESAVNSTDDTKLKKAGSRKIKSWTSCLLSYKEQALTNKYIESGMKEKDAAKKARQEVKGKVKGTAMESYIMECYEMIEAFEAENEIDPEATKDGAIGQNDSKATFSDNYSDGDLDDMDPIKTNDGSEGQQDSAATFDKNYSDGIDDDMDPIKTEDGAVGQKDSTAKDPAIESTVDDELAMMNSMLDDIFDDDDELI